MEEKGVSSKVVIAIVVVLIVVIFLLPKIIVDRMVGGLGGGAVPPLVMLTVTAKESSPGSTWVVLTIEHVGGIALTLSDTKVIANTSTGTTENVLGDGTLTVDQNTSFTYNYGVACKGESITVTLIDIPSNQMIYTIGPASS